MGAELISLNCMLDHLTPQDDPEAWKAILDVISEEFEERYRAKQGEKESWFLRIGGMFTLGAATPKPLACGRRICVAHRIQGCRWLVEWTARL